MGGFSFAYLDSHYGMTRLLERQQMPDHHPGLERQGSYPAEEEDQDHEDACMERWVGGWVGG